MTYQEASQKVLAVLFGVKLPTRRPRVRVERPAPKPKAPRWGRSQAQCLQGIKDVCERNKRKAPVLPMPVGEPPALHFTERVPGADDDREDN